MSTDLHYLLDNMQCNSEGTSCSADKKTDLPQAIADAIEKYEAVNGICSIIGARSARTNEGTYMLYEAPIVDWQTWFDHDHLHKLYAFCLEYGYTSLAEEIQKKM